MKFLQLASVFALFTASSLAAPTPTTPQPCVPSLQSITDLTQNFFVRVVAPGNADLNYRVMNFQPSGGSDQHLYLDPAGQYTSTNTLQGNVIHNIATSTGAVIRMCLGGDVDSKDGTTKLFFTKRSQDPRAIFDVYGGCATNVYELKLRDGADVCVRKASGDRWEFRYTPVGNALATDCQKVKLVPLFV